MSARGGPGYESRDSSGVLFVRSSAAAMWTPLEWSVDAEPDLVLGSLSGDDAFSNIWGVAALDGGGTAVVERSHAQVWFFDAEGNRVSTLGREGDGPGEFRYPSLIPSPSPDTLWVGDGVNGHFVSIAADGTVIEERVRSRRDPLGRPLAVTEGWVLVEFQLLTRPTGVGVQESDVTYLWENLASGARREIAVVPIVAAWVTQPAGQMAAVRELPFSPRPVAARYGDGAALTRGDAFRIEVYGLDGEIRSVLLVDAARMPVTDAALNEYFDWYAWRFGIPDASRLAEPYAAAPLPDSLPGFASLIEDSAGWLWAQIYAPDRREAGRWVVFDADGRAVGIVETPPGLEIQQIGEDYVLGTTRDALGIPLVQRHTLTRHE